MIQNTVSDQKLENRLGMPGNEARCTVPDEGGGTRLGVLHQMKVGGTSLGVLHQMKAGERG